MTLIRHADARTTTFEYTFAGYKLGYSISDLLLENDPVNAVDAIIQGLLDEIQHAVLKDHEDTQDTPKCYVEELPF